MHPTDVTTVFPSVSGVPREKSPCVTIKHSICFLLKITDTLNPADSSYSR